MANWLSYITRPFKKLFGIDAADERGDALRWAEAQRQQLLHNGFDGRRAITFDQAPTIPRMQDAFFGLIHDTDPLLEEVGVEAYDRIYNDFVIVRSLDELGIATASSQFGYKGAPHDKNSAKLIPFLSQVTLEVPGFKSLVRYLPKKGLVENLAIVGMTWKPTKHRTPMGTRWGFALKKFILKDKSRFAPARPDWSRMFLVDDGFNHDVAALNTRTGRQFEVDRKHFIIAVWDDIEERLGWGASIGPILYRLAYIRDRLLHIFARAIEMHGGGIRIAKKDANFPGASTSFGNTASETALDNSINQALSRMGSFDAAVFPPGVEPMVIFPAPGSIEPLQKAVQEYFDNAINRLINGTDLATSTSGTHGKAKVLDQTERIRKQYVANWVCEVLQRDYVERAAEYNQWIYEAAGVPPDTPLPKLVARVPGGHDRLEEAQILATLKLPVLRDEAYDRIGYTRPTQEQIDDGEVLEPDGGGGNGENPFDPNGEDPGAGSFGDPIAGTEEGLDRAGDSALKMQEDRNAAGNAERAFGT